MHRNNSDLSMESLLVTPRTPNSKKKRQGPYQKGDIQKAWVQQYMPKLKHGDLDEWF